MVMIMISNEIEKLVSICASNLKNSDKHIKYLNNRGVTSELIKRHNIGYFPQNISVLLKYLSKDSLMKYNVIDYSGYSDFCNYFNLIIPVYNEYGDAVGISGRSLAGDGERRALNISKYKNSSYKKSGILFGLNLSKKDILREKNVYVVEGYFDKLAIDGLGLKNSVAICGTAFSKMHFIKLIRYTNCITFMLDNDDAGIKSAVGIFSKFSNKGVKLRFLSLPEKYKDVDEYFNNGMKTKEDFFSDANIAIPGVW